MYTTGLGRNPPVVHGPGRGGRRLRVRRGRGRLRPPRPLRSLRAGQPLHLIHAGWHSVSKPYYTINITSNF